MSKRELWLLIALVVGASLLATRSTVYTVLALAAGGVLYLLLVRRSVRAWVVVLSSVAGIALFEVAGRAYLRGRLAEHFAPDLDHRLKPDPAMGINEDGIRCDRTAAAFDKDAFRIVFLGDSFTYGSGVEAPQAFPMQVEAMLRERGVAPKVEVANFGWPSACPLLQNRQLREIGKKYSPKLVVLALDMTDFHDDLKFRLLFQERGGYTYSPTTFLVGRLGLMKPWNEFLRGLRVPTFATLLPGERFFVANQPLRLSLPYLEDTEKALKEIEDYCRDELKCPFVLFVLPRNFQYSDRESPDSWERWDYKALGPWVEQPFLWLSLLPEKPPYHLSFPSYSLLPAFKNTTVFPTCFPNDPHWNPEGHRIAAEAVVEALKELGAKGTIGLAIP